MHGADVRSYFHDEVVGLQDRLEQVEDALYALQDALDDMEIPLVIQQPVNGAEMAASQTVTGGVGLLANELHDYFHTLAAQMVRVGLRARSASQSSLRFLQSAHANTADGEDDDGSDGGEDSDLPDLESSNDDLPDLEESSDDDEFQAARPAAPEHGSGARSSGQGMSSASSGAAAAAAAAAHPSGSSCRTTEITVNADRLPLSQQVSWAIAQDRAAVASQAGQPLSSQFFCGLRDEGTISPHALRSAAASVQERASSLLDLDARLDRALVQSHAHIEGAAGPPQTLADAFGKYLGRRIETWLQGNKISQ